MKVGQHTTQERRQHARGIRILDARKERGGGVAPRQNNRTTESTTKESREAKVKAKTAIQELNGKRQKDENTNPISDFDCSCACFHQAGGGTCGVACAGPSTCCRLKT